MYAHLLMVLMVPVTGSFAAAAVAPGAFTQSANGVTTDGSVHGTVFDSAGNRVIGATVRLEGHAPPMAVDAESHADGSFAFTALHIGTYRLSARKSELRSGELTVDVSPQNNLKQIDLIIEDAKPSENAKELPSSATAMELVDKPNFVVAGVTDWTAVGGHGSDSSLRTSEALTRETLTLKPEALSIDATSSHPAAIEADGDEGKLRAALFGNPKSFAANHQLGKFYLQSAKYEDAVPLLKAAYQINPADGENEFDLARALKETGDFAEARAHIQRSLARRDSATWHRLAGEIDEKLSDPLAAVHELEQAARLDPSEQNYFEWGSELLLHRAVWQAQEVFGKGADAYPKSARMLAALGTALFAGARYGESAKRLCQASDLNPSDPEPYVFMGKIDIAAPDSLECIEQKLARFAQEQPGNSLANYFYAMAIWKRQPQPPDTLAVQKVEALLMRAIAIDAQCSDGYLQLGILRFSQHDFAGAIGFYMKAIETNPQLGEAHYRLGVAYDRIGLLAKAKQEFALHDEIEKRQAAAIEQQRREVKQFQILQQAGQSQPR